MAADKAKKEIEQKECEELANEKTWAMMQMDIKEDNERAQSAAQTIRTFGDLDHDTEPDSGEEFVGYDEVSSGGELDSDDDSHHQYAAQLKVGSCIASSP